MSGSIMSVDPNDYMLGSPNAFGTPTFGGSVSSPLALAAPQIGMVNPMLQQQLGGIGANGLPKMPGQGGGLFSGMSGLDKAQLALGGLQTIGGLWSAFQTNKLAKQQFNFSKEFANANLANQIQSYNTALADRARSRAFVEGQPQSSADAYVAANSMTRQPKN